MQDLDLEETEGKRQWQGQDPQGLVSGELRVTEKGVWGLAAVFTENECWG